MQGLMQGGGYPPPVDKLLTYGDASQTADALDEPGKWPDYLQLGLGPQQIPDLVRMATDRALYQADSDSRAVWAPIHAMRALGQLHAADAAEPLLRMLLDNPDDDWVHEELPFVYGMIGPAAIPTLDAYLADTSHDLFARVTVASSLARIGVEHPEARGRSMTALTEQLVHARDGDPAFNAFVITSLVEMRAREAAPAIKRAFDAGAVDLSVIGDWEQVQIALGLRIPAAQLLQQRPLTPSPAPDPFFGLLPQRLGAGEGGGGHTRATHHNAPGKSRKKHKKRK